MSPPFPQIVTSNHEDEDAFLSRSASYNHLPDLVNADSPTLRRTFSDLTNPHRSESPSKEDVAAGKDILRRTSLRSKEKPTIAVSRFTVSSEDLTDASDQEIADPAPKIPETRPPEPAARPSKSRTMSGRLVSLARKPWLSSSPYRSPADKDSRTRRDPSPPRSQRNSAQLESVSGSEPDAGSPSRKRTILHKRPRRPMVAVVTQSRAESPSSPSSSSPQSLGGKGSLEKLSSSLNVSTPVLPPMPKGAGSTGSYSASIDLPRKKDELWGVFRNLEADFQK
jgi:hypothetical protein